MLEAKESDVERTESLGVRAGRGRRGIWRRYLDLLRLYLFVVALSLSWSVDSAQERIAATFRTTHLSAEPNYKQGAQEKNGGKLTDGETVEFPPWTKAGCLVWEGITPIGVSFALSPTPLSSDTRNGALRVHAVKARRAGIGFLGRIDVYSEVRSGEWRHIGGASIDHAKVPDDASSWAVVPVSGAGRSLLVVLHANGRYLALDEIQFDDEEQAATRQQNDAVTVTDPIVDSSARIKEGVASNAVSRRRNAGKAFGGNPHIWISDPYASEIPLTPPSEAVQNGLRDLSGLVGEHQAAMISLYAGDGAGNALVSVDVAEWPRSAWALYEVAGVPAADGHVALDALVPVADSKSIRVSKGTVHSFWLAVDLNKVGPGEHELEVSVTTGGATSLLAFDARVVGYAQGQMKRPRAVNWAYLGDGPIFRNREAAVADLQAHGIDVFVAHPTTIPGSNISGSWEVDRLKDFDYLATMVKRTQGTLLLYLGWSETHNPFVASDEGRTLDANAKLRRWVKRISAHLDDLGLSRSQWALYPVDEPDGPELRLLEQIRQELIGIPGGIQIYADPSIADGGKITLDDLKRADEVVDIWQPNLGMMNSKLSSYFQQLRRPWWVYENPASPAKRASPFADYLLLSWKAWELGASGVGFWSYSDTTNSSAWNDFDGRRPDWAVVYEADSGVVSSRRWEAFRKGLEDFALINSTSPPAQREIRNFLARVPISKWGGPERYRARSAALDGFAPIE